MPDRDPTPLASHLATLPEGEREAVLRIIQAREEDRFRVGYAIACANMVNLHGQTFIAAEVMMQEPISWADVRRWGLSEYDMEALRMIKREVCGRDPRRDCVAFADGRKLKRNLAALRAPEPARDGGE